MHTAGSSSPGSTESSSSRNIYFAIQAIQKGFATFEGCLSAQRELAPNWHLRLLRTPSAVPEIVARCTSPHDGLILQGFVPGARELVDNVWPGPAVIVNGHAKNFSDQQFIVNVDDEQYGQLVARHLLEIGLSRALALFPFPEHWSLRRESFLQTFQAAGGSTWEFFDNFEPLREPGFQELLERLPRPCGVFVYRPETGADFIRLAREHGYHVPEDFAVIAGNDHPVLSHLEIPSQTGVSESEFEIGRRACEVLIELMQGRDPRVPRVQNVAVPPPMVRGSSHALYSDDPQVTRALRLIGESLPELIPLPQVARAVGLSQNQLERRAKAVLGMTLREKRLRLQVGKALQLLHHTSEPISQVAQLAGFHDNAHLTRSLRRFHDSTPSQIRRRKG